ncbi:hypothetical protein A2U01_0106894, partial [Trifolium medium]|nr:hypothetical protein [Trifolium medium]
MNRQLRPHGEVSNKVRDLGVHLSTIKNLRAILVR